jgi:hypothetical protein
MGAMGLNRPPANLSDRRLSLIAVPERVTRLCRKPYEPRFWSKQGRYRFDSPDAPHGVLYTADSVKGAILEVWGDQWLQGRCVSREALGEYRWYTLGIHGPLRVADCTDDELNRLGTDSNFFATTDYTITRAWAVALMNHPACPEGICYNSRKNPRMRNFALFGRPKTVNKVTVETAADLLTYPNLLQVLDELDVDLIVGEAPPDQ